jgi:hypothetical protein
LILKPEVSKKKLQIFESFCPKRAVHQHVRTHILAAIRLFNCQRTIRQLNHKSLRQNNLPQLSAPNESFMNFSGEADVIVCLAVVNRCRENLATRDSNARRQSDFGGDFLSAHGADSNYPPTFFRLPIATGSKGRFKVPQFQSPRPAVAGGKVTLKRHYSHSVLRSQVIFNLLSA